MNIHSANFRKTFRAHIAAPTTESKSGNSVLTSADRTTKQSKSAFDAGQPVAGSGGDLSQQITTLISLLKTILESLAQPGGNAFETPAADMRKGSPALHGKRVTMSPGRHLGNAVIPEAGADAADIPVTGGTAARSGSGANLPGINPNEWSTRDGKNGEEFATPFVSKNVIKGDNSIGTQLKGNEGAEATLNKKIGTGFYQFNVNPKLSSQVGDIPTVFFYSGKGSNGGDYEGGFELDAEYNMVEQGTVTFGTWIDGKKYNQVTVPAPKGDQTIGFNIQNGYTQIGFVNADGSFEPVSETRDKRITPELASNLQAMTNTWRSKSTGGSDNGETSSITINGLGRADAPGQPVEAV